MQTVHPPPHSAILYGAGKYAHNVMRNLHFMGIKPVCFCDKDPRRWESTHLSLPVMNLDHALSRYPDIPIIIAISPYNSGKIYQYLTTEKKIPQERIPYYRKSCSFLEMALVYMKNPDGYEALQFCCGGINVNLSASIPYKEDVAKTVSRFFDAREQLIADNQNPDKRTICTGCPHLVDAVWTYPKRTVSLFTIADAYAPCQCRCIYCYKAKLPDQTAAKKGHKALETRIPELLLHLQKNNFFVPEAKCQVAPVEITIHPQCDQILDAVSGLGLTIMTNGIIFNPRVADLVTMPNNKLLLSLDAGTRETYAKVKGIDAFKIVTENITRYRNWGNGGNINLKYIVLPENITDEDITGFIQFASDTKIRDITLSFDECVKWKDLGKDVISALERLTLMARAKELNVTAPLLPIQQQALSNG